MHCPVIELFESEAKNNAKEAISFEVGNLLLAEFIFLKNLKIYLFLLLAGESFCFRA